jgi:hypothetical protein
MEMETPAESIVVDEAENQPFLGFKFGALINSEKSVVFQQLRKTLSTTWIGAERENFRRGLTLDLRQPCLVFNPFYSHWHRRKDLALGDFGECTKPRDSKI